MGGQRTPHPDDDDEHFESTLPVPPDGGWGWVVVASSFLLNLIVDGTCYSFGVFYVELQHYFLSSKAKTALVGTLLPTMYLITGPFVSALANKYGCRPVTMAGSVIACCAFFFSTFTTNIDQMIFVYGVLGGIGFGFMYLPSIVIVSFYFDKRRALATGIAVCGSGLGTFVFAPLCQYLVDQYSWKGANWILGGIILNCAICGALYRPLEPPKRRRNVDKDLPMSIQKNIIMKNIIAEKERQRTISTGSLDNSVITAENMLIKDPDILRQVQEVIIAEHEEEQKAKSMENLSTSEEAEPAVDDKLLHVSHIRHKQLTRVMSQEPGAKVKKPDDYQMFASATSLKSYEKKKRDQARDDANRPMFRQDIFFSGSVTSIAEYKSSQDMATYMSSIASMPSIPQDEDNCQSRCAPFLHSIKSMFDIKLFRSPTFLILLLGSGVLAFAGFFIPYMYMVENALLLDISKNKATFLLSITGICNIGGRLMAGWLADRPWCDSVLLHNGALLVAGVVTCLVPLLKTFPLLCAYSAVFGTCIAVFVALRSIVPVELLGLHRLTNSFGLMLLFQGTAGLIGSPVAGALFDATNSYTLSFIVSGCVITAGALLCLPVRRIAVWEEKQEHLRRYDEENLNVGPDDYLPYPDETDPHDDDGEVCNGKSSEHQHKEQHVNFRRHSDSESV